jgi:hypothetical protein
LFIQQGISATNGGGRRRARALCLLPALLGALVPSAPVQAVPPAISVRQDAPLRFGSFMVFGSGSRSVGTSGEVFDSGIAGAGDEAPAPAFFTVSYDRGNESRRSLDIEVDVTLAQVPPVTLGGIRASLSNLSTDLPGGGALVPGRPVRISMTGCAQRVCARSFRVGGRLDVSRSYGAGQLTLPLLVDAVVVSVK